MGEVQSAPKEGELLEISLDAILGTSTPQTMQLLGVLGKQSVVILIDRGSTHIFIDLIEERGAKLYTTGSHNLMVMVANEDWLPYFGCCEVVPFHLQRYFFSTTMYLLPLECDLILGVN